MVIRTSDLTHVCHLVCCQVMTFGGTFASVTKQYNLVSARGDHGNGSLMGIPWEWELMTKLGMGMRRNGKQSVWEWEWLLFPWE